MASKALHHVALVSLSNPISYLPLISMFTALQ